MLLREAIEDYRNATLRYRWCSGAAPAGSACRSRRACRSRPDAFVIVLVTVIPIGLFLWVGEPVALLTLAGAIEAAHTPVVMWLILYVNRRTLPFDLQPSAAVFWITAAAGLFSQCLRSCSTPAGRLW